MHTKDYQAIAEKYVSDVLDGTIPACRWVKRACKRQLEDLAKQGDRSFPYKYAANAGSRVCRFIELCPNVEGRKFAGKRIQLQPWQVFVTMTVFSWLDLEGGQRFRRAYTCVPKGSGKSTWSAPIGCYRAFADNEPGSQVYSCASAKDQAKVVWGAARMMLLNMASYTERVGIEIEKHALFQAASNSVFKPLAADERTSEGKNPYFVIFDELHTLADRGFYDSMDTATGKRQGAIMWIITTAGTDLASVCFEVDTEVRKVLNGVLHDETLFGIIYTIDDKDDWSSPESWAKANPSWGVCVDPKVIEAKAKSAAQIPSQQPSFKTKHLNIWCKSDHVWMDMVKWGRCADTKLKEEDFLGQLCIPGLDLASKLDILAAIRLFWKDDTLDGKRHYYAFGTYWTNQERIDNVANSQYKGWAIEGRLQVCPGSTNNYNTVEDWIKETAKTYQVVEVAHDPYQAVELVNHLTEEGITMVEIPQMPKYLSEPMKELEAAVYDGRFHFDGDPVLTWAISNVIAHADKNDNLFPNKERPENKIDPATALFTALNRVMAQAANFGEDGTIDNFGPCQRCGTLAIGVEKNGVFIYFCPEHLPV